MKNVGRTLLFGSALALLLATLVVSQRPAFLGKAAAKPLPADDANIERTTCCKEEIKAYQKGIVALFAEGKFDELDQAAAKERSSKARFPGGEWKLHSLYDALDEPPTGKRSTDAEWA